MKIAITGKGGVGKTTLSSILSYLYTKEGKR
ncbi:MAG: carbon monoxide dehydrogenase, partial [Nitrospirae bacterium]|nr:carbon monoxide dehydrogenase [Nitrospirota bacterium]